MLAILPPHTHTPVLLTSIGLGFVVLEHTSARACYSTLQVVKSIASAAKSEPFYNLFTNRSSIPVHVPKCMNAANVTDISAHVIVTETSLPTVNAETIVAMQHKPSTDRTTQMTCHKDAEEKNDQMLKTKWRLKAQLFDEYSEYCNQLLSNLHEFQSM